MFRGIITVINLFSIYKMAEVKKEASKVTLLSAYKAAWKKYAVFEGRLSRRGYWYFVLYNVLVGFVIWAVGIVILELSEGAVNINNGEVLKKLYSLVMFLPSLAASTRRLHDSNKSGWFNLLALVPVVGQIILIVFLFQKGDQAKNQYGPVSHE